MCWPTEPTPVRSGRSPRRPRPTPTPRRRRARPTSPRPPSRSDRWRPRPPNGVPGRRRPPDRAAIDLRSPRPPVDEWSPPARTRARRSPRRARGHARTRGGPGPGSTTMPDMRQSSAASTSAIPPRPDAAATTRELELPADHGADRQQRRAVAGQRTEPFGDGGTHPLRNDRRRGRAHLDTVDGVDDGAAVDEVHGQLLDVERVALGGRGDRSDELDGGRRADHVRDERRPGRRRRGHRVRCVPHRRSARVPPARAVAVAESSTGLAVTAMTRPSRRWSRAR